MSRTRHRSRSAPLAGLPLPSPAAPEPPSGLPEPSPGRPGVSVLTPVHRPIPAYLAELHECLDKQEGVEWEWLVQVDGGRSALREIPRSLRDDPRVGLEANGRWFGQAVTRNLALVRASHPLLQTVDADDLLLPGALAVAANALEAEPDLALAFGRTWELDATGRWTMGKNLYPPGRLEPGVLERDWESRGGSCSIVVASAMWRTSALDAQCGWPASVAGTDVILLLAVTQAHPARVLDADTYLYRSHAGQLHRSPLRFTMRPKYRDLARRMLTARSRRAALALPPTRPREDPASEAALTP